MKKICIDVKTYSGDNLVDGLCVSNCNSQQLNSILNLCKAGFHVDIDFSEKDIVMPPLENVKN